MFQRARGFMQEKISLLRYKRLATNVQKPIYSQEQLKKEGYYSQCGQDKWIVEKLFAGKTKGVFADIGANDGISFSNTYVLEKSGWTGIAVEPIPSAYEDLVSNRQCLAVNGCIAPESGKAVFKVITGYAQMLSGLAGQYDSRHLDRIQRELDEHGGECKDIEVDCYNFNELLERNNIHQVDYLSIDAEGAEYEILTSIDFDRIRISAIGVENNYRDYRIPELLVKKGFVFHSIVGDEFYLNRHEVAAR